MTSDVWVIHFDGDRSTTGPKQTELERTQLRQHRVTCARNTAAPRVHGLLPKAEVGEMTGRHHISFRLWGSGLNHSAIPAES